MKPFKLLQLLQPFLNHLRFLTKWFFLVLPVAFLSGTASAFFLKALDWATQTRWQNGWLIYFLPLAGVLIIFVYNRFGGNTAKGNNLLIDEIHKPGGGISWRMAPLVFLTSVVTHLFGGSAGREGTAVQMGGSMASFTGKILKLNAVDTRILLTTGIAAGFGSIFGTPFAGAVFAIEVLTVGRLQYDAIIACLFSAILANIVCLAWGVHHTQYAVAFAADALPVFTTQNGLLLLKSLIAAIGFGLVAMLFSEGVHGVHQLYQRFKVSVYLRPVIGGVLVIALVFICGTRDYLGLGVQSPGENGISILNAFHLKNIGEMSWAWKLLFTATTLGSGFKGGEVTPLFFIGACLGNALAYWFNAPTDLFAAMGFIAVFAGASNTPLACTIMGAELFGTHNLVFFAMACFTAYFFSGHTGIYLSQRLGVDKLSGKIIQNQASLGRIRKFGRPNL